MQRLPGGDIRPAACHRALVLRAAFADQIERRFRRLGEIRGFPVSVSMHVKHAGALKEKVVVKRRCLQPVQNLAVVLFFLSGGFVSGYLLTRIYLASAFE